MSRQQVTALLFQGGAGASQPERMLAVAQQACALDSIELLLARPWCERLIVATPDPDFAAQARALGATVEADQPDYHFGRRLAELVDKYRLERVLYLGGGSTPLLTAADYDGIVAPLEAGQPLVASNNFFSTDFAAFYPAEALLSVNPPETDNNLAWTLHYEGGLDNQPLPRRLATQFDIDTPTDILILSLHQALAPRLTATLASMALDTSRLRASMRALVDREAEITIAGRVGSHVWQTIETDLACRKRIYAEERGMRASGREARAEVHSLLGSFLQLVGSEAFFANFARTSQALFVDDRVIFRHLGLDLPARERFYSDLLQPDELEQPLLRDFTRAARDAGLAVVLGGHSLVSAGLLLLVRLAWQEHDAALSAGQ